MIIPSSAHVCRPASIRAVTTNVEGGFHNIHDGVKRGDVVSIENDETALRYCQHGYCQTDLKGELGAPFHRAA